MISVRDIRAAVSEADAKLPRICSNGRQLRDISDEALKALQAANNPPVLFARSGQMVAVVKDEKQRLVIAEVNADALCGHLTRSANYFRVTAKLEEVGCPPPTVVVKDILALPPAAWQFPPLDAIVAAPIIRPDGTILDTPGYDAETHLFYAPDPELHLLPIPENPTSEQVKAALELLDLAIGDFPFEDKASRANLLAAMLTPIIKPAIDAPSPLGLLDAPQEGTGKSLLCDVIAIIATGRAAEMFSAPKDPDEWRKVITTALLSGTTVVTFDNISRPLDNPDLCSVLTSTFWADRAMRTHSQLSLTIKATFLAPSQR